ncbi:MarR family transcriptional regulator [Virgibacillus sp. LDC-1]|uniref:MarR family winged helix-turn-helix transcriptional regulator n=1 Tax=Virgibacillus sp. LDC-1 TaxID=3039856 RepID=UPI0024DEFDC6|nr:MarR family transcriptional regulator [Virgibacillus sp. LDC-1]
MNHVKLIMSEMLQLQQKSKKFVNILSEGESLSQNQLILLLQLEINGGMKATEIADFFSVTPGAVTSMCDKLEKLNLVKRERKSEDRRIVKIVLTNGGEDKVHEIFMKFPQEKLTTIAKVLKDINKLMNSIV